MASKGHERKSLRENRAASIERTPGASSSSTRTLDYIQVPAPPGIPAPPPPSVRARAIRVDISDPDQWSQGDTAILKN